MPDDSGQGEQRRVLAMQMSALGLEFAGSVLGGLLAGFYLDRWLGTSPWMVLVGTLGGMVGAVSRMLVLTRRFQRGREDGREKSG
jgi:ATP synthase protein I